MLSEVIKSSLEYLLLAYGSCRIVSDLIALLQKCKQKSQSLESKELELLNQRKPPHLWNTAFFFPDIIPEKPDSVTSSILQLIDSARLCIQLCVYMSSFPPFETAISRKYREGLIIQVITQGPNISDKGSKFNRCVEKWREIGIHIRMMPAEPGKLMHHKFIIIDDEALLTGSLNWTVGGVTGNRENLLVTTDPRLVGPYKKEYCRMWNEFEEVGNPN